MLGKKTRVVVIALALLAIVVGCVVGSSKADTKGVSGTVNAAGSSALLPLVQSAAKSFMDENPDSVINTNGGGSGQGLQQVSDGTIDIGDSDLFAEEKLDKKSASKLVDHQVAITAIAPIVNKDAGVKSLTTQQLIDVYTGKVTNWNQVGGNDCKIVLISRPASSGTRATFEQYALNKTASRSNQSLETDDSGTLIQMIQSVEGAVGYVALSYLTGNPDVTAVAINGVKPTLDNVYNGSYKVWNYEHMYTKGQPKKAAVKAFLKKMLSKEYESKVEGMGYGVVSKLSDKAKKEHK
ncbi:phosphate ABC transporter substrate-binding protein [Lactobacillus crispatus]|uniref:Phosphate-binding protein n=2 Tax=Lactobacillus crispatus TaxID=47770 RepID=A0A6A1Z4S3_9LACO|nr:phosphate ABC transporter substrate-binding protein [Lactobacillus crispatus]KAB1971642.1 phosphate ABC transporter substrate-binding protein [Lactobacillus crispatus]MCT3537917.1 phosphate ABC transporter substrate-binding protein [Lactobacillus crispatus]